MSFLNRLIGAVGKVSPTHSGHRTARGSGVQFRLERLEDRDLKSGDIAGVSANWGMLTITAPQTANNHVALWYDQSNLNVAVDGQVEQFARGSIFFVNYTGGSGGGDTFNNATDLLENATGYGGNNHFTGSSTFSSVTLWGGNNTFSTTNGGSAFVFDYVPFGDGPDNISQSSTIYTSSVNYDPAWFGW